MVPKENEVGASVPMLGTRLNGYTGYLISVPLVFMYEIFNVVAVLLLLEAIYNHSTE